MLNGQKVVYARKKDMALSAGYHEHLLNHFSEMGQEVPIENF